MKEIKDIIRAFEKAEQKKERTALATVVHVEGSSYRRAGARMLITEDGTLTGAISGGCLEGDALKKALFVINQQKSMVVTYDTMDDDDAKFGVGLGCNGIIHVLIEPINAETPLNPIHFLRLATVKRQASVIITLFSIHNRTITQPGTCIILAEDGTSLNHAPLFQPILDHAKAALADGNCCFRNYISEKENYTAFIEYIQPPIALVIAGAGNDVLPLTQMAGILGWDITVADGRASMTKENRFQAGCRLLVSKPAQLLEQVVIDNRTAFLLMSHNYHYDLALLRELLKTKAIYIGSLGPRKKVARMLDDLSNEGIIMTSHDRSRIYGPIGLDIGAETPEEIGLSILAEINAVFSNRTGQSLRTSEETIHDRSASMIEKVKIKSTN